MATRRAPRRRKSNDQRRALDDLAKALARNYFCATHGFDPTKRSDFNATFHRVFKAPDFLPAHGTPRARNIVIVGAGMSFGSFGGKLFPLAAEAIRRIRGSLKADGLQDILSVPGTGMHAEPLPNQWQEEVQLYRTLAGLGDAELDFESQLAVLGKFYTVHQIRAAIAELYDKRFWPHISTEVLAHLLKHRFVDAIINYNFDETLDQAIAEEVRGGDYRKVISDGDCPRSLSELVIGQALKVPLYIKPHGTVSHKSTLRFTKRDYFDAPSDLLRFTETILHGYTEEGDASSRLRVNLIAIGFHFGSVELSRMLKDHHDLTVWHINPVDPRRPAAPVVRQRSAVRTPKQASPIEHFIGVPSTSDATVIRLDARYPQPPPAFQDVADVLLTLVNGIRKLFNEPYVPRSIARHQFVHDLSVRAGCAHGGKCKACPPGVGRRVPAEETSYLRARVNVELAIAVAKGQGRIDLTTLVNDRVGLYFQAWRDAEDRKKLNAQDPSSLRDFCEAFLLKDEHGFIGNLFTIPTGAGRSAISVGSRRHAKRAQDRGKWVWKRLVEVLYQMNQPDLTKHLETRTPLATQASVDFLTSVGTGEIRELAPRFHSDELLLVRSWDKSAVIHTNLGMQLTFESFLNNPRVHLLLAITEHGAILRKMAKWQTPSHPRVSVVVAELDENGDPQRAPWPLFEPLIGRLYRLPYWAHNEHMLVALERQVTPGEFLPIDGVWYRRVGLSNRISPVRVSHPRDLAALKLAYFGHVAKAEKWMGAEHAVPDINHGTAEERMKELLDVWWREIEEARS
jgi:hypothetical protein